MGETLRVLVRSAATAYFVKVVDLVGRHLRRGVTRRRVEMGRSASLAGLGPFLR